MSGKRKACKVGTGPGPAARVREDVLNTAMDIHGVLATRDKLLLSHKWDLVAEYYNKKMTRPNMKTPKQLNTFYHNMKKRRNK